MVKYKTLIKKFADKGEKTSWTYIDIPLDIAEQLIPNNKKAFRVKGRLDNYSFEGVSLLPMGEGNFIMALKSEVRKAIKKEHGATLTVELEVDLNEKPISSDFLECLQEEPNAVKFFYSLPKSHQKYFSNWIESAKTIATKANRIAQAVNALAMELGFSEMIRKSRILKD